MSEAFSGSAGIYQRCKWLLTRWSWRRLGKRSNVRSTRPAASKWEWRRLF